MWLAGGRPPLRRDALGGKPLEPDEQSVRAAVRGFLEQRGWLLRGGRSGVDIQATKTVAAAQYTLLVEVKGNVGIEARAQSGQRLKYVQHALGQLVCRTGPREYGYSASTLLGAAFPQQG